MALVVDDDPFVRRLARGALEGAGIEVEEAADGAAGLERFRALGPDIVLLDVRMPGMDGFALCRALRNGPEASLVPILMLTGLDDVASIHDAYECGATDFIAKPINWTVLPYRVSYLLSAGKLLQRLARSEQALADAQRIADLGSWHWRRGDAAPAWSQQLQAILGAPADAQADAGRELVRRAHPDDRAAIAQAVEAAHTHGRPYKLDLRIRAADGLERVVHVQAEVVADAAAHALSMQGTLQDITVRKQAESELQLSKQRLREVLAHQDRVKEEERIRIAREIHDELGGLLTGVKSYFSFASYGASARGQAPDPHLLEAAGLADQAIDTLRRVISDLRPSVLDHLGIWAALEWHAGQVQRHSGLACSVRIDPELAGCALGAERSTALFRIVQESLTNTVRHAAASAVRIEAYRRAGSLYVSLHDDGAGIDPALARARRSWGIEGMHERARYFGGDMQISGAPGSGTTVLLRLPLEDSDGG